MTTRPDIELPARTRWAAGAKGQEFQVLLEDLVAALGAGARMPSERQLADRYGIARGTVRAALERLAIRGLIYRRHGLGSFVAEPRVVQADRLTSFSEDMRARGLRPGARLRSVTTGAADRIVADRLELDPGERVIRIERVRTADGEPMALERSHLPAARFPDLDAAALVDGSLYEVLERRHGVRAQRATQTAAAVALSARQARALGAGRGDPALLFQRLTRDRAGSPFEFVRSWYRADRYEVRLELTRAEP